MKPSPVINALGFSGLFGLLVYPLVGLVIFIVTRFTGPEARTPPWVSEVHWILLLTSMAAALLVCARVDVGPGNHAKVLSRRFVVALLAIIPFLIGYYVGMSVVYRFSRSITG